MSASGNVAAVLAGRLLPPLPPIPPPLDYRGPTPWSNWVIKGRLLAGAFPASADDAETDAILTRLLELGVDAFVCLQAEFSMAAPEAAWRSGQALRPYVRDAQRLLVRARTAGSATIRQTRLDLLHLPIVDGSITSDHALSRLADDCCQRVLDGQRLYVHCWGGHGRTGTLIAVMLGRLYGLTAPEALAYTQALHDVRRCPQSVRSPQTAPQVEQVRRILGGERPGAKAAEYRWPETPLRAAPASTEMLAAPQRTAPISAEMMAAPQRAPPPPPLIVRQDTASAAAAAAAAVVSAKAVAAEMQPPVRSESLIPAGVMGGSETPRGAAAVPLPGQGWPATKPLKLPMQPV